MFVRDISCRGSVLLAPEHKVATREAPYVVFHIRGCVFQLLNAALEDDKSVPGAPMFLKNHLVREFFQRFIPIHSSLISVRSV